MIDLARILVHTADIYHVVASTSVWSSGATVSNTAVPVECFAYFGDAEFKLDVTEGQQAVLSTPTRWHVLLPPSLINSLKNGARIANLKDEDGNSIRGDGVVESLDTYRHPYFGAQLVIAKLGE